MVRAVRIVGWPVSRGEVELKAESLLRAGLDRGSLCMLQGRPDAYM